MYICGTGSRRKEGDVKMMGKAILTVEQQEQEEVEAAGLLEKKLQTVDHHHFVNKLPIYVPAFPLAEINDITDNFSNRYLIAEGSGGGRVFHRVLKSGQDAVIKLLHTNFSDHEFITQVNFPCIHQYLHHIPIYISMEQSII